MKAFLSIIFIVISAFSGYSQNSGDFPYKIKPGIDIPITAAVSVGGGFSYFCIVRNKDVLDSAYLASLRPSDVNRFDRGATYYYSRDAQVNSDISQGIGYLLPSLLLFNPVIRDNAGRIGLLYLQTMAFSGFSYAITASFINRKRPYAYNPDVSVQEKQTYSTLNSFFAGHPATVASATFFTAKVFK